MEKNRAEIAREKENLAQVKKMVADFKRSLFDMYKGHLEMISNIPEENEELPPPSAEIADIEIDEAKDAILSAVPDLPERKPEHTSSFIPPSPEDFV